MPKSPPAPEVLEALAAFHQSIDAAAGSVAAHHGPRIVCRRGCAACCVDDITVWSVEAERIRRHLASLPDPPVAHAPGACAFLDPDGACQIYEHRPYVCRTQGLPLRWIEDRDDGGAAEFRDICPLNDESGPPLESLPPETLWSLGPAEERLRVLEDAFTAGSPRRVALRALLAPAPTGT